MLGLLRLFLGPVLLWQGARVRRDILRMPEPAGPRGGTLGTGAPLSVLLLGDSSIAGVGAEVQDHALSGRLAHHLSPTYCINWQVVGRTGWTTQDAMQALTAEQPRPVDVAVLSLGVNDVTTETGISTWLETYSQLVVRLRNDWKVRVFVLSGLPMMGAFPALPQPLRWYLGLQADAHQKALFDRFNDTSGTICVPLNFDLDVSAMAEDGFHPGPLVYDVWAEDIANIIRERFRQKHKGERDLSTDDARRSIGT